MRNLSAIMLILALILGTITVFFTRSIIQNQRSANQASISTPVETELSSVVVAVIPMKFGDELTSEKLKVVSWPADIRPEGSFETIAEILGSERRVVLRSIGRNEPVVKEKISGFGSRASLSQIIEKGHRAAAIRVNDVLSVGGFILPGDRVDVVHTYQPGQDRMTSITNIIIEDVRVLGIDQISDEGQEGAVVGKSATLEVTPEQVQKIALAANVGHLSLSLRRLSSEEDEEKHKLTKTIKVKDLKPATVISEVVEDANTGKKKIYRRPFVKKAPKPSPFGDMIITRGTKTSDEKVLKEQELNLETNRLDTNALAGAMPSP